MVLIILAVVVLAAAYFGGATVQKFKGWPWKQ